VKGFAPIMPKIELTDDELAALVAYIQSYGSAGLQPPAQRAKQ
jgi:cytochrome c oxidase subunit II